uniref:Protease inhibitor n=1 Tax=Panstrongylus lignarius TaxID=156445 RepID=A0A224XQ98_9HEMI
MFRNLIPLVLFTVHVAVAAQKCQPGSRVPANDGCNYCLCTDEGITGQCTTNDCEAKRSALLKKLFAVKRCAPGTWVAAGDGCNKCNCTDQGILGPCTILACPGIVKNK